MKESNLDADYDRLKQAILNYDKQSAEDAAKRLLDKNVDPVIAIEKSIVIATKEIGERFKKEEIFLTELMMAADAADAALTILRSRIPVEEKQLATIIIGTVKDDIHDMGKNIVASILRSNGFTVHDLGVEVQSRVFVEKAIETNADIIAASALMTTTRPNLRDIVAWSEKKGVRTKFKIVVGGGAVTSDFARDIGADGFAEDAASAVEVIRKLLGDQ